MTYKTFVSKSNQRGYKVTHVPRYHEADITQGGRYVGFVALNQTNIYGINPDIIGKEESLMKTFTHTPIAKRHI